MFITSDISYLELFLREGLKSESLKSETTYMLLVKFFIQFVKVNFKIILF